MAPQEDRPAGLLIYICGAIASIKNTDFKIIKLLPTTITIVLYYINFTENIVFVFQKSRQRKGGFKTAEASSSSSKCNEKKKKSQSENQNSQ